MRFEESYTMAGNFRFSLLYFWVVFSLDDHCHYLHCSDFDVHDAAILA